MNKKVLLTLAVLLFPHTAAAGNPISISGTFFKGAALFSTDQPAGQNVLQIRGEEGFGNVTGGVLTGSAIYTINEEIISLAGHAGTFHAKVAITTVNGSAIRLALTGFTSGATPTAQTVIVNGSWTVLSASSPDLGLRGEGQFTGIENFQTGEIRGKFSGMVQLHE